MSHLACHHIYPNEPTILDLGKRGLNAHDYASVLRSDGDGITGFYAEFLSSV